jgi:hypothetical protein
MVRIFGRRRRPRNFISTTLSVFICSSDENRLLLFWARVKLVPAASTNLQRNALEEESYEDIKPLTLTEPLAKDIYLLKN